MDRREELSLPGSSPYYMQRPMPGPRPGVHGSLNVNSITSMLEASYQGNPYGSALPPEHSSTISPQGVNVGATSVAVPQPQAEVARRKRGRPRKYGPDSSGGVSLGLSPASSSRSVGPTSPSGKRGRGRPPGSGRKQQLSSLDIIRAFHPNKLGDWLSSSAGTSFTPHVITAASGEDIATKIMSFVQQSCRAICVLSASGAVSSVTLQQSSSSGGTVRYEGRFEILCLSGSYLPDNNGGPHSRTGGLSISLASPDGRVVGGGVGGLLIAASHVQVVVGSFSWGKTKNRSKETQKPADELDLPTGGIDPVAPSVYTRNDNLSPPSSVGMWPGSQSMNIDLMRE